MGIERWGAHGARAFVGLLALTGQLRGETHQDFDNPGAPFLLCSHFEGGTEASIRRDPPAMDFSGNYLRLATSPAVNHNSAIFDTSDPGPGCRKDVTIDFDFRMTPQAGQADGLGLALLRDSHYGEQECVPPEDPYNAAEEPNFQDSLGIGFDIYQNPQDESANHVSVHWGGGKEEEFQVFGLPLASSDWIHARIRIRPEGPDGRLTVVLKPKGTGAPVVAVPDFLLQGFAPYAWRLWLGARSGGESADHDVDNLHVAVTGCPEIDGQWDPAILPFGRVAIHASLLPTGKVLLWDRHDYDPPNDRIPQLWDPDAPAAPLAPTPDPGYDLFCAGHAFRADGGLFVTGGHRADSDGEPRASTYDAFAGPQGTWTQHPDMNAGRWYPTTTTLADGALLTVSGDYFPNSPLPPPARNTLPQVFDPGPGTWRDLTDALKTQPLYPFMFLAPNGRVFDAGPQPVTRYLDTSGTGAWSFVGLSSYGSRDYGSAAMYAPGQVMILGGSPPAPLFAEPPTNSVEAIDLYARRPRWRPLDHMTHARRQHTATLLPDGTVLVTGGSSARGFQNALGAVLAPELWDPAGGTWRTLAPMQEARMYHSTALLLPSGKVLVAGGGHPSDADNGDPSHLNAEVFSPPYLFQGPRPTITSAPASVAYGQSFLVETADAGAITDVTWVRLGAVTHGFDQNQRFARLRFQVAPGGLQVDAPADGDAAPPGHYLLFILRAGVPSVARILRIG